MFVWRDEKGRITSVTGSVHMRTLEYLLAEDEGRETSRPHPSVSESESEVHKPIEPRKAPARKLDRDTKGVSQSDVRKDGGD